MTRKWREIRKQRSPEREARIQERIASENVSINYSLAQLRTARKYTQAQLAKVLDVAQNAVSKVEHRPDVYLSTLRSSSRPWAPGWRSGRSFLMRRS